MGEFLEAIEMKKFPRTEQMESLDLPPELAEEHIKPSLMLTDVTHKLPEWDMHREGPTGCTVMSRRELAIAKGYINSVRNLQNNKKKTASKKWSKLKNNENDFRRVFLEHNKLIKENLDKAVRSDQKIADEIAEQVAIRADIKKATKELTYLKQCASLYKRNIKAYRIYENFLEQVVLKSPTYDSAGDVFNSYVGMVNTRDTVTNKATTTQDELMKLEDELSQFTEELRKQILEIAQEMKKLNADYERASQVTQSWDRIILKGKVLITEKNRDRYMIQQMFYDLYSMSCLSQGKHPTAAKDNLEEQLNVIKQYVNLRRKILKRAKRLHQKKEENQENKKKLSKFSVV